MAEGMISTMPIPKTERLPRSPTSLSSSSSGRASRPSSGGSENLRRLPSPPLRSTRKRAASIELEGEDSPTLSQLSIDSPRPDTGNSGSHVCLCQPDPKIPRPRNAFILYRQHYQGQVIAQNPGLANPEISKIIGAQWREQSPDVQSEWKRLAEEEKLRHQRQYPDYRYQPRRANKANAARASATHDDPYRCSKCNGRFISQPVTPATPFPPTPRSSTGAFPNRADRQLPSLSRLNEDEVMDDRQRQRKSPDMPSAPRGSAGNPIALHRPPHLNTSRPYRDESDGMQSPRAKRPRPDSAQSPYPSSATPTWADGPRSAAMRTAHPGGYADRHPYHPGRMEPPAAPTPQRVHFAQSASSSHMHMDGVRLPPIRTEVGAASSGMTPATATQRPSSFSATKSIEAMVMSIPFLNKIKVISKIAPPLQPPGPTSPAIECRGPVIAVEGTDPKLIAEVGRYLESFLSKEDGVVVRSWSDDAATEKRKTSAKTGGNDVEMAGTSSRPNTPPEDPKDDKTAVGKADAILEYLDNIRGWHPKSAEITKFITTIPHVDKPATSGNYFQSSESSKKPIESPQVSPTSTPASLSTSSSSDNKSLLPVALLPYGYSLTSADRAASTIPIDDAYAPVDHWQWMATLWRGIIGVDLTIYVNTGPRDDDGRAVAPTLAMAGVDVRPDARAIILQCQSGRLEEKMLRRTGFEVGEWVRNVGSNGPRA